MSPKNSTQSITLKQAIEGFVFECQARQLSVHTLEDYNRTLQRFLRFLGNENISDIQTSHIVQFFNTIQGVKPKTMLNMHIALSALWSWLVRENYACENILHHIPRPKGQQTAIVPFTEMEIRALFSALGRKELRNRTILMILLDTGLRASELVNLSQADIDLKTRRIRVWGKGNKERYIPISARTASLVFKTLVTADTEHPFGLTRTRLAHMLQEIGKRAGIPKVHPHRFRHTFAVYYLRNGGDVFSLQAILGHSSMEMVKRYVSLAQVDLDAAHRLASPVTSLWL